MLGKLLDWYIARRVRKEQASLPAVEWKTLHDSIRDEIEGYTVFLETREGRFVRLDGQEADSSHGDVVGLVVAWLSDGVPPWETEEPAEALAKTLSRRQGLSALVQVSRSLESFVGYYVKVRPLLH